MKNRILSVLLVVGVTMAAKAQTTNYQAYSLFVYGLSKYMSWPSSDKKEFVIAVFGKSQAYDEMVKGLTGKSIGGMPVKVVQTEDFNSVGAQILYVSDSKSSSIDQIIKATVGKPTLVIAEREGLYKKGAGISFIAVENKLRIDINNTELQSRQIKASTQLQALANQMI